MWYQCNTVVKEFLSTLSLRRATRVQGGQFPGLCNFYPRSPCGERLRETVPGGRHVIFLSTLSLRRATQWEGMKSLSEVISIHALLAESDLNNINSSVTTADISIHALLAESDHAPSQRHE